MSKRKAISKKVRFEIFKRDYFTCQYCGDKAPNVILEVDHIHPVSKGGGNDSLNLITSCHSCNNGKRDILISDTSAIDKQRLRMEELQEKRNQIEMMAKWRDELAEIESSMVDVFDSTMVSYTSKGLNDHGRAVVFKLIRQYGLNDVLSALDTSIDSYYDGSDSSAQHAFDKVKGILIVREKQKHDKYSHMKYSIRKILKEKFRSFNDRVYFSLMDRAINNDIDESSAEFFKNECLKSKTFNELFEYLDSVVNHENYEEEQ